jgi:hypothetical protein
LARAIGYLATTSHFALEFRWPKDVVGCDQKTSFDLYTDSDWSVPRSQSSFCACIWRSENDREDEAPSGFLPIHFGSKRQRIGADAVSAAEIVAAHVGVQQGGPPLLCATQVFDVDAGRMTLRIDNNVAVGHVKRAPSNSVIFLLRAVNARHGMLRDACKAGVFGCTRVPTALNRSDIGTKALGVGALARARAMIGIVDPALAQSDRSSLWQRVNQVAGTCKA